MLWVAVGPINRRWARYIGAYSGLVDQMRYPYSFLKSHKVLFRLRFRSMRGNVALAGNAELLESHQVSSPPQIERKRGGERLPPTRRDVAGTAGGPPGRAA